MRGGIIGNIGRVYTVYVGVFLGFIGLMWLAETKFHLAPQYILWSYMLMTVLVYAFIGYLARTAEVSEYYVAGRSIPAMVNGMATAADWLSGASFVGMAGTLYLSGYDGLAYILGWTGGYVLVAVLLAPYLRKFGAFTVPDFIGTRYGGNAARVMGIVVLFSCSLVYVTAQIYTSGLIASRFLGISTTLAVWIGLAGIIFCSFLGGMRAVTWTQVAQYIILIVAYITPVTLMSIRAYGDSAGALSVVPQLAYGGVIQEIQASEQFLGVTKSYVEPFMGGPHAQRDFFFLVFSLMLGTASLPHILMRFFTTPTVRSARVSVGWSLLFIFFLYVTAPAYAAFAKSYVMSLFGGEHGNLLHFEQIPQWMYRWGGIAGNTLVQICGVNATDIEAVRAACSAKGLTQGFGFQDLKLHQDIIVLATPEIAGLPWFIVGLVGAGGFAAALSTADGLLLAIANALSHDVYYKIIDPRADARRRLRIAKILLLLVATLAAWAASREAIRSDILKMVSWAFSIAASGMFSALVLGVWWRRTTSAGAIAGMFVGYMVCMTYLLFTHYLPVQGVEWLFMKPFAGVDMAAVMSAPNPAKLLASKVGWFDVQNISAAVFGVPASLLTTIIVSLLTPAPSPEMQAFIGRLRIPRGGVMMTGD